MGDLLKGLPTFNAENFSKFYHETTCKSSCRKPAVYLPTEDHSEVKVIVTDKTNILLRYLHQQLEAKNSHKKRDTTSADLPESTEMTRSKKVPRLETVEEFSD